MDINELNEKTNEIILHFQNEEVNNFFDDVKLILDADKSLISEKEKVSIISNTVRTMLVKNKISTTFIEKVLEGFKDYPVLEEYTSFEISKIILKIHTEQLDKITAINNLLDIVTGNADQQDKINALIYLGNFILISGNEKVNQKYLEQLDNLKNGKELLVDELDLDKLTHRFNHSNYDTVIKVLEIKLQNALLKEEGIDPIIEEIIDTTAKLQADETIYDPEELSLYALAKLKKNNGYIDLTNYFMELYNQTEGYKGYVLESYYDYLNVNYPQKIETDFKEVFNMYWENHYADDIPKSQEAFLYTAADFLSGFFNLDVKLEDILEELERIK